MKAAIRIIAATAILSCASPPALAQASEADAAETPSPLLREGYDEALAAGLYSEAETLAKTLLDRAMRGGLQNHIGTAELLSDLAHVQRLSGDLDAALQNYERAIGIVESNGNNLDLALIEPLLGAGNTHIDRQRPDLAVPLLDRALHVRHVNDGPHSLAQAATLESLANAYRQLGQLSEAADAADRLVLLYGRNYPGASMEIVPALLKKGRILGVIGNRREERNAYIEAQRIAEANYGDTSAALVAPLVALGDSHRDEYFQQFVVAESEQELPDEKLLVEAKGYYESALHNARTDAGADWQTRADALLAMGDFYTMSGKQSRARVLYREAWNWLSVEPARLSRREASLEAAVPLLLITPDLGVAMPFGAADELSSSAIISGHIVTQFSVTRLGRLADIVLVEIQPDRNAAIEAEVKIALSRSIYRPRLERGLAVDTPGLSARFEFPLPAPAPEHD